jgi:hypothetical protein
MAIVLEITKRDGLLFMFRKDTKAHYYGPVSQFSYTNVGGTVTFTIKTSVKEIEVYSGSGATISVHGKILILLGAIDAVLSELLDESDSDVITADELKVSLDKAIAQATDTDKVVRADDSRAVAPNDRKHGISDCNPNSGLPVDDAGTLITTAHEGFRNGNPRYAEQLFLPQTTSAIFARNVSNGKWSSWNKCLMLSEDQVDNLDNFGQFLTAVNRNQPDKPEGKNGIMLAMQYGVNRYDGKWGAEIYINEVNQNLLFRKRDNGTWGVWQRVLTDRDRLTEKVTLDLVSKDTGHFTFQTAQKRARFIGFRQANGEYLGYVEVDCSVKISAGDFTNEVILETPAGWQLAETIQACGDLFQTGSGGHFWRLWSENDNIGNQSLLRTWNNNSDVPRNVDLRLMYNFPAILKQA